MIPGFRYLASLTALGVAAFFTFAAFGFGLMAEPNKTDVVTFLLLLGLGSQVGPVAAPWLLSRGLAVRLLVAILMAPTAVVLGGAAWDGALRFAGGNPISSLAWTVYVIGLGVYALAYVELIRTILPRRPRGGISGSSLEGADP